MTMQEAFHELWYPATRGNADVVAKTLVSHRLINEVLLFGSVARDGHGEDLDLILITDEEHYEKFIGCFKDLCRSVQPMVTPWQLSGQAYLAKLTRLSAAQQAFDNFEETDDRFSQKLQLIHYDLQNWFVGLDIFVFPPDWRDRLDELQGDLPHGDPNFMANIAKDAIKIA